MLLVLVLFSSYQDYYCSTLPSYYCHYAIMANHTEEFPKHPMIDNIILMSVIFNIYFFILVLIKKNCENGIILIMKLLTLSTYKNLVQRAAMTSRQILSWTKRWNPDFLFIICERLCFFHGVNFSIFFFYFIIHVIYIIFPPSINLLKMTFMIGGSILSNCSFIMLVVVILIAVKSKMSNIILGACL